MSITEGPLRCMYVTADGALWAKTEAGWCWLRENWYESGWHWEYGYDEPLAPVTPILDILGSADTSRVAVEALMVVRKHVDYELGVRGARADGSTATEREQAK